MLRSYEWAQTQSAGGACVIGGFHSKIEKDVLRILLAGKSPVIVALARGMKKNLEPEFVAPLAEGRLLIITPFPPEVKRVTEKTAALRNALMLSLAQTITLGDLSPHTSLNTLLRPTNKTIINLSLSR